MALDVFNLSGKVALVTGGSKGLGKAMARGLAEAGADILISSRHEEELRPALGSRPISKIEPLEIQGLYADMQERGLSARTVRFTHAVLRSAPYNRP